MGILDKVVKIEKRIEKLATRKDAVVTPIEIRRDILDDVEAQVQPAGRGRRVFPYDEVSIEVLGTSGRKGQGGPSAVPARAEIEAVLEPEGLAQAIRERLEESGCERLPRVHVTIKVVGKRRADWRPDALFQVKYERSEAAAVQPAGRPSPPRAEKPVLPPVPGRAAAAGQDSAASPAADEQPAAGVRHAQLSVVEGEATRKSYPLTGERTNIGRLAEVADKHRRIVRRNQVVFLDAETEANQTVSRAQAHIRFTPPDEYRLFDDHSSYGTRIARGGRMIELPSGSPRGVKLQSGDEIYFGRARVVFQLK